MPEANKTEKPAPLVPMMTGDFISILVLGGVIGLGIWGVGLLLNSFVFANYFCQDGIAGQCEAAKNYAVVSATVIGAIAGLMGLIRLRVYRPLLVLIATIISLWGLVQISWDMTWYIGALVSIVLYLLAFGTYTWLARIRDFWISLIVIFVLVIAVRLAIVI